MRKLPTPCTTISRSPNPVGQLIAVRCRGVAGRIVPLSHRPFAGRTFHRRRAEPATRSPLGNINNRPFPEADKFRGKANRVEARSTTPPDYSVWYVHVGFRRGQLYLPVKMHSPLLRQNLFAVACSSSRRQWPNRPARIERCPVANSNAPERRAPDGCDPHSAQKKVLDRQYALCREMKKACSPCRTSPCPSATCC